MIFDLATSAAIGLFCCAGLLSTYRLLLGPSLADRVIALDVTLISFMGAIAVHAAKTNNTANLIMLIVLAIIGFTATVTATRFIEHEQTAPTR